MEDKIVERKDVKELRGQSIINMDHEIIKNYDKSGVGATMNKE